MQLDQALAARLTSRFGMRLRPEDAERIQAHRKRVGVASGASVRPEVLERLLFDDGVPCAWAFSQDDEFTYFDAYYIAAHGAHHGDA